MNTQIQQTHQISEQNNSIVNELKNLKDLLDCGAISQEEYDKCKDKIINR